MSYSKISSEILQKINDKTVSSEKWVNLVLSSTDAVLQQRSETARNLHNKLLAAIRHNFTSIELGNVIEKCLIPSHELSKVEQRFLADPSDMRVVYELGVGYYQLGKHARALQLLRRVASSGYKENIDARAFLSKLP